MKQVHIPHTDCDHPKTPKARAACRRLRRAGAPETPKAEIVARIKGTKKIKKAKGKKTPAPIVRELLELVNDPPVHETFVENAVEACEQNEPARVEINVVAKGSKVVHKVSGSDDAMLFACTKRPINVDTATITTNDVTCKNCLKVTK